LTFDLTLIRALILIKVKVVDIIDIHLGLGSAWAP